MVLDAAQTEGINNNFNNLSTFGELALSYTTYGTGKRVFLAFHGFGRSFEDFKVMVPALGADCTIYAFNIFHHGDSQYPAERIAKNTLQMEEIGAFFENFLNQNNIETCSVMGYSLGGKVALSIAQTLPERVDAMVLIAPDGIYINKWYKFASHNRFGRWVSRGVMKKPETFLKTVNTLNRTRLLSKKMHRFIHLNFHSPEVRQQVYDVWMTFRNIDPDMDLIAQHLNSGRYSTLLIFGRYDKVIPPRIAEAFLKKVKQGGTLKIREAGHVILDEKSGELVAEWLEEFKV